MIFFQTAKSGIYKDIWHAIMSDPENNLKLTGDEGLMDLRQRNDYAVINDATWLRTQLANDCDISLIRETFYKTGFGLALPEGSPYKKYFDEV